MMGKLLCNEIRKTMQIRSTYIFAGIALAITLFFAWYCVTTSGTDLLAEDGSMSIVKGRFAIPIQKKYESALQGEMTVEKLENALSIVQESYDEISDSYTYSEDMFHNQMGWGMIQALRNMYPQFNAPEHAYPLISQIQQEFAGNYYNIRAEKLNDMFHKRYKSSTQLRKAEKMSADVKVPFTCYSGYSFWNTVFEYFSMLQLVVLIIAALFAAPMFSEGYNSGADAIFRTTKHGKKSLAAVRVTVSIMYGLILFILTSLLFLGISVYYFGTEGLKSSIQMMNIYSIANMTYWQALLYMLLGGVVSIFGTVCLVSYLSAKTKKPVNTTIISIVLIIGYKAITLSFTTSPIMDFLFTTLPMSGTDMIYQLHSLSIYNIFQVAVWEPCWSIIAGILLGVVFFIATVSGYARKKY